MKVTDEIAENLDDVFRKNKGKIFYWHVETLRGSSQSGLVP